MSVLVPEVVRNKALAAGATAWLDELPGLIADLERDWDITVGRPFPDATEAFVAEASGPGPGPGPGPGLSRLPATPAPARPRP